MTKADALWEKFVARLSPQQCDANHLTFFKSDFLAALKEYGEAVRAENVCICGFNYDQHTYDKNCDSHGVCPDRQGVFRNERQHELVKKLEAENAELRKDAARYRWLRDRMQVRNLSAVSGRTSPALAVRVGFEFLDTKTDPKRGWTNPKYFDEQRAELDTAIDQARSANDT